MLNANYVVNDIVTKSIYVGESGKKMTTYENVNGNYNGNFRVMFNTPLKNRKFSVNSMTMASFANVNGFINEEKIRTRIIRPWNVPVSIFVRIISTWE